MEAPPPDARRPAVGSGGVAWPGPPCIDVHVHLHPPSLAHAIQRFFAAENWITAHPFDPPAVAATLAGRGVERFCFFTYAHKPGMAHSLNAWVAETAKALPGAIPFGTAHVDDPDLDAVVDEAVGTLGLRGLKFHHSVQRFHADDRRLFPLYERAEAEGWPLIQHAGTMPYRDTYTGVAAFRRVMQQFPRLRVCVAHMGAFDTAAFLALLDEHPHLYLDTTMAMTACATPYVGADPAAVSDGELLRYQDRILFGSDFPLIPYDYDEERRWALDRQLPTAIVSKIFRDNARRFLGLG